MTKATAGGAARRGSRPPTSQASSVTRRAVLKRAVLAGGLAALGPWCARRAHSSSGELNLLSWSGELPDPLIQDFTAMTGITVNSTSFSHSEEQIEKLQTSKGQGFDLCQPRRDRAPQYQELGLLQPFDLDKLQSAANLIPSMLAASKSAWTWDGKLYHLPHCWGGEGIAWLTDSWKPASAEVSFGNLWDGAVKGRVLARAQTLILGTGLWLDSIGKLSSNRMLDSYQDEATMRKIFDAVMKFAIARKDWIRKFWSDAGEIQSGFTVDGCALGLCWDAPIFDLARQGKPMEFRAPKEGAIAWLDGWAMPAAAQNVEQAYAWLDYLYRPETAAKLADGAGGNPVVQGADALMSPAGKKLLDAAYPDDAFDRLWWRPPEPVWFRRNLDDYARMLRSA